MTSKSPQITDRLPFSPVHPGEVLAEEISARGLSANQLARALDVPGKRLYEIIAGRRGITADTALRLATYFGTSARFWMNLQTSFDLGMADRRGLPA